MVAADIPDSLAAGWWLALAVGLVVAVVVMILLHALYRQVKGIERNFQLAWEMGKQVARNTASTWMLGQTARLAGELKKEALEHDAFLASRTEGG